MRKQVQEAVERWMMSDVPLACSLSGGLDFTYYCYDCESKTRITHTYSLGFENESEFDERRLAKLVAQKCGTRHTEIVRTPDELFGNYSKWLRYEHPLERYKQTKHRNKQSLFYIQTELFIINT